MTGTLLNAGAIVAGAGVGVMLTRGLPDQVRRAVMQGIGLAVILVGIRMALQGQEPLILIGSLVIGGVFGASLDLEGRLTRMGNRLEHMFGQGEGRFAQGFVTATLVYCVGAMAIMGALEDGLTGKYDTLAAKSMLDGISAVVFSSSLGIGVAFSAVPVLLYQGGISLLANRISPLLTEGMITEMTTVGGALILGIGLNLIEATKIKVANLLPAVIVVPALVLAKGWLFGN